MAEYFENIPQECPYLFYRPETGKDGVVKYHPLGDFKKAWSNVLHAAGITDFHFHDGRHISATDMVNAGTPERVVSDIAGWSAGSQMLSRYYHRGGLDSVRSAVFAATEQPKGEVVRFG